MRILTFLTTFMLCTFLTAQVGINTNTPHPSAMLDVESTTQGFLPPRMDEGDRDAITDPATGLVIYNTDEHCLQVNTGTPAVPVWVCLGASSTVTPPAGEISSLNCGTAMLSGGPVVAGTNYTGTTLEVTVEYSGGNGGTHNGQTVISTGVTGLTATLASGSFNGTPISGASGTLTYNITGTSAMSTPANPNAVFALAIGGRTCSLTIPVNNFGTIVGPSGRKWMDRNLGARQVATSPSDAASYGDLYQWGREADGHEKVFRVTGDAPTSTRILGPVNGFASRTIAGSNFFGHNPSSTGNIPDGDRPWVVGLASNAWNNPSGGAPGKGVFDPCPTGFRVPTSAEWAAEFPDPTPTSQAFTALKLPFSGARSAFLNVANGGIAAGGGASLYHSSSTFFITRSGVDLLRTESVLLNPGSNIQTNRGLAVSNGSSIRCIEE